MMINTITQGDSFDLIGDIKDNAIDLIVCDGPYKATTLEWDRVDNIQKYNLKLIQMFSNKLRKGGVLYLFGKSDCIDFIDYRPYLKLQRKIIWYQPSSLSQGRKNFTNNYDIICYFTKGNEDITFNLDCIRVPQLVELEHRKRCERVPSVVNGRFGKTKFNGAGKNPGDVWGDIKQLTYKSKELIDKSVLNTIQKPEKLMERIILASSNEHDVVLDPFCGVGTVPAVCSRLNRNYYAFEINKHFVKIGSDRVNRVPPTLNTNKQNQKKLLRDYARL